MGQGFSAIFTSLLLVWPVGLLAADDQARTFDVYSPNGQVYLSVELDDQITYSVSTVDHVVLEASPIGMKLSTGEDLGAQPVLAGMSKQSIDELLEPVVRVKSATIRNRYNELTLDFEGSYSVTFRVFDNGAAYRFEVDRGSRLTVADEIIEYRWPTDARIWFGEEEKFQSHNERSYKTGTVEELDAENLGSLPVLVDLGGLKALVSETDLRDYPGLWVTGAEGSVLKGTFAPVAARVGMQEGSDRNEFVLESADYIAEVDGTRTFPWRFIAIAENDADLIMNQLSYQLAGELEMKDTSWIRPGKVAWDWWNYNNVYGVDFRAGVNTETYKHYIDFAADYGLEYIIMDEGWYQLGDLLDVSPEIDVEEIIAYGKEKGVGVILWVIWKTLDEQLDEALPLFAEWGAAGLKIDFMARNDQWMVNYYWRMAEAAAKYKMLVNFHGSYKPAGIRRAWPNVLTREGVRGLEHNKWSDVITPTHNLTLPFIRMVAGPMDYTPGAMVNANKENFRDVFNRPMSMTTRAQQVAMFVLYESPMQMLADSPSNYRKESETTAYIARIPAVWDETRVIEAEVGQKLAVARRSGDRWFVGAMTNEDKRSINVDLSFLDEGAYEASIFADGINADRYAGDYLIKNATVTAGDSVSAELASGGGWVAILEPKKGSKQ